MPIYPMKVERRQAREELDSVNVIERRTTNKSKRWFVLVCRPERERKFHIYIPLQANRCAKTRCQKAVGGVKTVAKEMLGVDL